MKKNIEIAQADREMVSMMADQLYRHYGKAAAELCQSLDELLDGTCQSVLLELSGTPHVTRDSCICCGDLSINLDTRRVVRGTEELSLTPKEYDILCLLARNRGQVFTKEQIYQAVWAEDYLLDSSNIMAFIRKLRKKIEPTPDSPQYILTVWGIGYKFNEKNV